MAEPGASKYIGSGTYKVLLVGDGAVGKTSLVNRAVSNVFSDKYIQTIGVNIKPAPPLEVRVVDGLARVNLHLWDLMGQHTDNYEQASGLVKSQSAKSHAAMIVCDVTRKSTLYSIETFWKKLIDETCGKIPFYLLANKIDVKEKKFGFRDLEELAIRLGVPREEVSNRIAFVSAKTGENVFMSLKKIAEELATASYKQKCQQN